MTILFIFVGLGVVFLLYVLANFWKDGHPAKQVVQKSVVESLRRNKAEVIVITHPISLSARGGLSVIHFPVDRSGLDGRCESRRTANRTIEMPVKRFSTR